MKVTPLTLFKEHFGTFPPLHITSNVLIHPYSILANPTLSLFVIYKIYTNPYV